MDTPTHIPWNFVTKNIERDEFIEKKVHDKVATLGRHLKNFPLDSAHLHVALERNPKKDEHTVRLTLRVPSNILHSEKTADDLIKALGLAVDSLVHDLEAFKAILTGERFWKRRECGQVVILDPSVRNEVAVEIASSGNIRDGHFVSPSASRLAAQANSLMPRPAGTSSCRP